MTITPEGLLQLATDVKQWSESGAGHSGYPLSNTMLLTLIEMARRPTELHVVFDDGPGPVAGRFIECELPDGRSVRAGDWRERPDGNWAFVLQAVLP